MPKVPFNPKGIIYALVYCATVVAGQYQGMSHKDAELLGSISGGFVTSFGLRENSQSISDQLVNTIDHAMKELLDDSDQYELPDDCKETLRSKVFSDQSAVQYIIMVKGIQTIKSPHKRYMVK